MSSLQLSATRFKALSRRYLAVVVLLMVSVLALAFSGPSYAYDESSSPHNQKDKPSTWCQYCADSDFNYTPKENKGMSQQDSYDLGAAGCGNFAFTAMEVRAGVKARGYTVLDMRSEAKKLQDADKDSPFDGQGWLYQNNSQGFKQGVENITNGELTLAGIDGDTNGAGRGSNQFSEDDVRNAMNEGYFVVIMVQMAGSTSRHWIAGDYVEGNTVHTIDSGAKVTTLDRTRYPGGIGPILKFSRKDGKKLQDLPHIDEASTNLASNSGDSNVVNTGMLSDFDLPGMPPRTQGETKRMSSQDMEELAGVQLASASFDKLSQTERDNIVQIKEQKQLEDAASLDGTFSLAVSVVGLLLIVWDVLLAGAYAIDLVFSGVGAFTFLTFGGYAVPPGGHADEALGSPDRARKWLPVPKAIGVMVLILLASALLTTGILAAGIHNLVTKVI